PLPPLSLPPPYLHPPSPLSLDSDSDNFLSLKKSAKPQETPQQTKRTPTSVLDYFGGGSVQRSDKKLVASTKRKADHDESLTDEVIAQQLQMDEDMELERLVHEDEEFARTLAMLDQEPHAKKVKDKHTTNSLFLSLKDSTSTTSQSQSNGRDHNQDVIGPSPKKVPPLVKTSSKLALMKRREVEEEGGGKTNLTITTPLSPKKERVSPKKEFLTPSSTDRKSKPKTGSVTMVTTRTTLKTSPKKEVKLF
uniref:Replication factor C subunit 1-like n=1 Tax=Salmo trutta TaxID=8032 RepID=A0A673ZRB8_SALTR